MQRSRKLTIRLSLLEYVEIRALARQHDMKPSSFLRTFAFAKMRRHRFISPREQAQLAALVSELRRIGSNINQVVRYCHTQKRAEQYQQLKQAVKQLEDRIHCFFSSDAR